MKIVIPSATSLVSACKCGWKLPKEITLVPAGLLKSILTAPTATLKGHVDTIQVTCPGCGVVHACGVPSIVR